MKTSRAGIAGGATGLRDVPRLVVKTCVVMLALALVVFVVVDYAFQRHVAAPDIAATANSAAVVQSADRVSAVESDLLAEMAHAEPWLDQGAQAVIDSCSAVPPGFLGAAWGPVVCRRSVTAYFGFNGEFDQRVAAWEKSFASTGLTSSNVGEVLEAYAVYDGKPEPGDPARRYTAADLPDLSAKYTPSPAAGLGGAGVGVAIGWAEDPNPNRTYDIVAPVAGPDTVIRAMTSVDSSREQEQLFASNHFVAIVSIESQYYGS